uniref:Uncharacterized protein n=1 Tax=Rhizophora mucronata TaxID=61149 RepID=A0A2P2MJ90_RHIMU
MANKYLFVQLKGQRLTNIFKVVDAFEDCKRVSYKVW